jgi:hypothetical protein
MASSTSLPSPLSLLLVAAQAIQEPIWIGASAARRGPWVPDSAPRGGHPGDLLRQDVQVQIELRQELEVVVIRQVCWLT